MKKDWQCFKCSLHSLPFSNITDNDMLLTLHGFTSACSEKLSNIPSFTIQSLLDQMPGQKFSTDEFLSDSIESTYYTPAQFISERFSKNSFTMIHLNIASLQRHIDELRTLLSLINHPFDVICVTETRLYDDNPSSNISIEGYDFIHTPTSSQCRGCRDIHKK